MQAKTNSMKCMILGSLMLAEVIEMLVPSFHMLRHSQDQAQEYIGRNFHLPQSIYEWVALVAPEVPIVTRHEAIEIE